ncbi:unnamed protein product [Caenorhabditis nigoni]
MSEITETLMELAHGIFIHTPRLRDRFQAVSRILYPFRSYMKQLGDGEIHILEKRTFPEIEFGFANFHIKVVINDVWFHQQHYSHDVKHVEMVTVLGEVVVREVKTFTFEVLNEEANEPRKYDNTFVRYALPDEDPIPPTTEPAETGTEAEEGPIESEEQPSQYDGEETDEEEEAEPEVEEEEAPEVLINLD